MTSDEERAKGNLPDERTAAFRGTEMFKLGHLPLKIYKMSKIILVTHLIMSAFKNHLV